MKLLLLGGNGQVGWQLRRSLAPVGDVIALDRDSGGDLLKPDAVAAKIRELRPDAVVNAAAYTAVDRAEDEPDLAYAINGHACDVLAAATAECGSWLVHYSTDYVYRGDGSRAWVETDACDPLGVYGKSKLAGDRAVVRNAKHLIFRTCWVFDSWGGNFLKSIVRAATQRDELKVVSDQWGAPTRAATIADVTAHALGQVLRNATETSRCGIYHLAARGETNWNEYARLAIDEAARRGVAVRASGDKIRPIPAAEYGARAPRPANSRLDTTRLRTTFGLNLPSWQEGVRAVVAELAQSPAFPAAAKEK
ncbi:MAG TPA: dTDP-4-dehydrorhamnose reductase [Ramlibacter sp.]|nr:dTDP-4-dehydrorhamnose reductase [Ramlibacter sp.]